MIALAILRSFFALIACLGTLYLLATVFGALRFQRASRRGAFPSQADGTLTMSILKPVRGLEPELFENLCSFCAQAYPAFDVVFGVQDASDPAIPVINEVIANFPERARLVVEPLQQPGNPKVANLTNMFPHARGEIIVIADADMRVDADYLAAIAVAFGDPRAGAVTCPYTGEPRGGLASELAVLQLNDQFAPSVLVATMFGDPAFCFGSTMAVRRSVLAEIGGLEALASTIADDYMLGALVTRAGYRVHLSRYIVRNVVHERSVEAMLEHELRWARTIRSIRPLGYASTFVTFPLPFALLSLLLGPSRASAWIALIVILTMRLTMHFTMARLFGIKNQERLAWLLPLRDCLGLYVWVKGLFGSTVTWKDQVTHTRY